MYLRCIRFCVLFRSSTVHLICKFFYTKKSRAYIETAAELRIEKRWKKGRGRCYVLMHRFCVRKWTFLDTSRRYEHVCITYVWRLDRLTMIDSEFIRKRRIERIVPVLQIFEVIKIQLSLYIHILLCLRILHYYLFSKTYNVWQSERYYKYVKFKNFVCKLLLYVSGVL